MENKRSKVYGQPDANVRKSSGANESTRALRSRLVALFKVMQERQQALLRFRTERSASAPPAPRAAWDDPIYPKRPDDRIAFVGKGYAFY